MKTLVWGNALFGAAVLAQLLLWRIKIPLRQAKALGLILLAVCGGGLCALVLLPGLPMRPQTAPEFVHLAVYLAAFSLAYLITYSAVEVDSPSLVIMRRVAGAGSAGVSAEELSAELNDDVLVRPRIDDLAADRMAVLEGGLYCLAPKGAALASLFYWFRRLLKAGKGG